MRVTAEVQDTSPPRVAVVVTEAPSGGTVTVYRVQDQKQAVVRGMLDVEPSSGAVIGNDFEQPMNRPVSYRAVHTAHDGTVTAADSQTVIVRSPMPWLVDPLSGSGLQVTIVDWTTLQRSARQKFLEVAGSPYPVVMSDTHIAPSSQMRIMTADESSLYALRALIGRTPRLLVNPSGAAVESAYVQVGDYSEERYREHNEHDWRRLITLSLQEVAAPPASIPASGDTLMDLHEYVGGDGTTLSDLVNMFGAGSTLFDIATTQLTAAG
ncbi:hypothetical protein [uncultured Aeromicrobium sp.]|uniref:hypothetical protein n=1 Tax=uncultured Aeromicrobium sp. TaxID=337820 RepID=UPI0025CBB928|nr:hypothetical protein [uncultured Aeromicrobium sp.]